MNISHFFIDRPIFACVISVLVLLLGAVAYVFLPVAQFPDIVPPTVVVTTSYPGASAETVVNTVALPIEKQVNGVDRMLYITTSCTSDGDMQMTVTFEVGTDPDMATVLVQNRVKIAEPVLPEEVTRQGVTVKKKSPNMVVVLNFYEPKDLEAKKAGTFKMTDAEKEARGLYLTNFVVANLQDRLARVEGVGDVTIFDTTTFSMRIWLNPDILASRNISVQEITSALEEQNIQVAAGRIGEPPTPRGTRRNVALTTLGRLTDASQFENMILRTSSDGSILYLRDVATIELGAVKYLTKSQRDGLPNTTAAIYQNPGANSLQVADSVAKELKAMSNILGEEVAAVVSHDATKFVRVSIEEVKKTLFAAVLIVVLIVFVFLQDWRAALIPCLTVPVSLVGCFFLMWCIGFSINSLTLFGLILVIGIVVDDAIIVVENTQRLIDTENLGPVEAARKAMNEVSGPIIATTFVLMSIFIPTAMTPGIVGDIYRQFALTIAGAVCISAMCALTFAPALAAIMLRKSLPDEKKNIGFRAFNYCFNGYANFYLGTVKGVISGRFLVLLLWFGLLGGLYAAFMYLPTGFIPNEDQGVLYLEAKLPEGASQERSQELIDAMQAMLDEDMEGIETVVTVNGHSLLDNANSTNSVFGLLVLTPWKDRYPTLFEQCKSLLGIKPAKGRPGSTLSMERLLAKWTQKFSTIPDAMVLIYPPPPILGLGNSAGSEMQILDQRDNGVGALSQAATDLVDQAVESGLFSRIQTTFRPYAPRLYLDIDREKVKKMGVSLNEVFAALEGYYGSVYVNDFNRFDNVYHVMVQAQGEFRDNPKDVLEMKFKNPDGKMVPVEAIATLRETVGPQIMPRFQLYTAAYVQAQLRPGISTGQGMAMLSELAADLPSGFDYGWTGMSYQEAKVGSVTGYVFALSVIFAFFVLAAQYESWSAPIIILMAVPLGIGGAILAVALRGIEVNIYTQIGFILMVGLSAKNAILITEFAMEKRRSGEPMIQSAFEAGRLRLRPIMMTSFAFILGIFPLLIASGAGANSRHAIGTPVFGGMLTETMVGIYVTPVLFVLLTAWSEAFAKWIGKTLASERETVSSETDADQISR